MGGERNWSLLLSHGDCKGGGGAAVFIYKVLYLASTQIFLFMQKDLILHKCFATGMNQFSYAESP
jgi:hypothetical protein